MDFLNNAISQLRDLFKTMTPGSRMTAGMLLVLIVVSLVYLFAFQDSKADRYLFGSREFSDKDMAIMQRAFSSENLDDYMLEGKRIRVPGGKLNQYMQALDKAKFSPADIENAFDEIRERGSSFLESEKEKEFWRGQAQQKKLADSVALRPEIDWATVSYREAKTSGFPPKIERKATVIVCGANNLTVAHSTVKTIRAAASAWFAIGPEDVTVVDQNGGALAAGESLDGLSKEARMYANTKSYYEAEYRGKIRQALSFIGPGLITEVNVEMDPTVSTNSLKVTLDPQAVAMETDTATKLTKSQPADGGRPGSVPNEVNGNEPRTLSTVNNQESSSEEGSERQVSATGHEQTRKQTAGLMPKTVTATVSVPKSYFAGVWRERNPTPEGEDPKKPTQAELDKIEKDIIKQIENKVVKTIPPLDAGEDQIPQVDVSSYDDLTIEPLAPPSMTATTMSWFSMNWRTLGLFAIGLVSLFVLRGMIRGSTTPLAGTAAQPMPEMAQAEEEVEEEEEETPVVLHRRTPSSGNSLRDELTVMVREDPDAAANVLRTWIGDAA